MYAFLVKGYIEWVRRLSATVFLTSEMLDFLGQLLSVHVLPKNYSLFCKIVISNIIVHFSVRRTSTIFKTSDVATFRPLRRLSAKNLCDEVTLYLVPAYSSPVDKAFRNNLVLRRDSLKFIKEITYQRNLINNFPNLLTSRLSFTNHVFAETLE